MSDSADQGGAKRIGVFGGTFDPVHIGHLMLAEEARVRAGLSQVLFMPTHIQPFKQGTEVMPDDDRVRMLRRAVRGNPAFAVTTAEVDRQEVSYTILSLRALKKETEPEEKLAFIVGTDMFLMVEKWYLAEELLREFDFIVGVRPGYRHDEAVRMAAVLRETYGTRVDFVDNAPIALSATEIRGRVARGTSIRYLVPECVRMYLLVREKEGDARFAHTKRVIDLAAEMARRFGADPDKTYLAALLHDFAKDPAGGVENNLLHGRLAADAARREFGIEDEDVLNAIRFHTTGRGGMSRLELIVFLADTVEPGRTYQSIGRLRETCLDSLEHGAYAVLVELKAYLLEKGFEATQDTEDAIEDLRARIGKSSPNDPS
jgi:nicotinate-nucleotide adenylyltransferase